MASAASAKADAILVSRGKEMDNKKEPWLAVSLSLICPGLGLAYSRRFVLAGGVFLSVIISALFGVSFITNEAGDTMTGWALLFCSVGFYMFGCVYAFRLTVKSNSPEFEIQRRRGKDLNIAFLLSTLVPGIGHLYLRRFEGLLILILYGAVLLYGEHSVPWFIYAFARVFVGFSVFLKIPDAARWSVRSGVLLSGGFLCTIVLIWFCIFRLIPAQLLPAFAAGESMLPTLREGDLILAKYIKEIQPRRGDIVGLRGSDQFRSGYVVKRLIGLQGDTVTIVNDMNIIVNSKAVDYPPYDKMHAEPSALFPSSSRTFVIPKDSVFVLGDNLLKSNDSRVAGSIPRKSLVGVFYKVVWPLDRIRDFRANE